MALAAVAVILSGAAVVAPLVSGAGSDTGAAPDPVVTDLDPSPVAHETVSITCWDGSSVARATQCGVPSGRDGLATVFPSLDASSWPRPRSWAARPRSSPAGAVATWPATRAGQPGFDRFAAFSEDNRGLGSEWVVGRQFTTALGVTRADQRRRTPLQVDRHLPGDAVLGRGAGHQPGRPERGDGGGRHGPTAPARPGLSFLTGRRASVRHVDEPRVVALEGDGDVAGGAVAVLGHDQVGLAGAGRTPSRRRRRGAAGSPCRRPARGCCGRRCRSATKLWVPITVAS